MVDLPEIRVSPLSTDVAVGNPAGSMSVSAPRHEGEEKVFFDGEVDKAAYKIEVFFGSNRSSLAEVPSMLALTIWESGKKLHGGGDSKMYWCGYKDCRLPISSDLFGYMHCVCPSCNREQFLDPQSKRSHVAYVDRANQPRNGVDNLPVVTGEKFAKLTPPKQAELLYTTWHQLGGNADIYLKFSPQSIIIDPLHDGLTTKVVDKLHQVRTKRDPVIYTLAAIRKDLAAGADLMARLRALVTA